jgi:hypothetical protein
MTNNPGEKNCLGQWISAQNRYDRTAIACQSFSSFLKRGYGLLVSHLNYSEKNFSEDAGARMWPAKNFRPIAVQRRALEDQADFPPWRLVFSVLPGGQKTSGRKSATEKKSLSVT